MKTFATKPHGGSQLYETESSLRNLIVAHPAQLLWNSNIRHKGPLLASQLSPFHTHLISPKSILILGIYSIYA
jgi:hypothetical protein